jgi:alanyl-tRNA synthetase
MFMIADGLLPSNKDAGYILRRLLRRATMKMKEIDFDPAFVDMLVSTYVDIYAGAYPELPNNKEKIVEEMNNEIQKFSKTLEHGLREFEKITDASNSRDNIAVQHFGQIDAGSCVNELSGSEAFTLFTTYGFPLELIEEESQKRGLHVDRAGFQSLLTEHQQQSRSASVGKFKGGMAEDSPKITALHSATHLMLAALRKELGDHVAQAGSNITEERSRFDFTHNEKVDRETLDKIETYVNQAIAASATMNITGMAKQQAMDEGVVGSFWEKYPEKVKVYAFTSTDGTVWSRELCGGPHVDNTSEIAEFGTFKIKKEESSSAGVRRIKAVLE